MTAHDMEGDRERCLAGGRDGYLAKPIEPKAFVGTIEAAAAPATAAVESSDGANARAAFDESVLLARFSGNQRLLRTLVKTFRNDCPRMMAGSAARLARVTHGHWPMRRTG